MNIKCPHCHGDIEVIATGFAAKPVAIAENEQDETKQIEQQNFEPGNDMLEFVGVYRFEKSDKVGAYCNVRNCFGYGTPCVPDLHSHAFFSENLANSNYDPIRSLR